MDPLWIIDLTGTKDIVSGFYNKYWEAHRASIDTIDIEPWFYITDADDLGLNMEEGKEWEEELIRLKIKEIIHSFAEILTVDRLPENKKIKYPLLNNNTLNVVFIGDIKSIETQHFFNLLSTELRKKLLSTHPWTSIPNVFFYGLLFRRGNVSIGTNLSINEKIFLHQLHNLINSLAVNNRPFFNVLLCESDENLKDEMISAMALATLHIGLGDSNILQHYQQVGYNKPFLNLGVAGVFYEQTVQNEREAFMLGHSLIDDFINSESSVFFNKDNAIKYANQLPLFNSDLLSSGQILKVFTTDTAQPSINKLDFEPSIKPCSWSLKKVWREYFNDFIINLKKDLVNKVRFEIQSIEELYKEKVAENQFLWIKEKSGLIEDGVFNIFKSDNPQPQCSILQAVEVADQCSKQVSNNQTKFDNDKVLRINDSNGGLSEFIPFPLDDTYQKAYDAAVDANNSNNKSAVNENKVLEDLESKLKFHPVFFLAMLSRAILIGIILIFIGIPLIQYLSPEVINLEFLTNNIYVLGFVLFIIPILIFIWRCRSYTNKLESLREQYIALSLVNLNKRVTEFVSKTLEKSYTDIFEFCIWLRDKRLKEGLRQQLGVLPPPDFSFETFEHFQPLLVDNVKIDKKANFLITPDKKQLAENKPIMTSGQFNQKKILSVVPDFTVRLKSMDKKVTKLNDADKMELLRELMAEKAEIFSSLERETDFSRMKVTSSCAKTLLLDVSGSMSGEPLEQLIKVVTEYKEKYGDQIRWIGFAREARLDKDVNDDILKAESECGGGTAYVPAFDSAKENLEKGELYFDKLVMISDGGTCDIDEAIKIAKVMGKPVDVIYIGEGSQDHLKRLADETGGQYTAVDKVEEIEVEVRKGLQFMFTLGDTGKFEFWELLKKGNVEGCARALRSFSKRKMISSDYSIEKLLETMGDNAGIGEWFIKASPSCSLSPGIQYSPSANKHFKSSDIQNGVSQNNLVQNKLNRVSEIDFSNKFPSPPDIFASILTLQPLEFGLRDLHWSYDDINDLQIKNGDNDPFYKVFIDYLPSPKLTNLCGQEINNK